MSLDTFRSKVQQYARFAGRTQKQIAHAIGLHHCVLSHKLNATDGMLLNHLDIKQIIRTLAHWQAIMTQQQAVDLLENMQLRRSMFSTDEWCVPPLSQLEREEKNV